MNSFRLAGALLQVPKLFFSLIFFPLALSLILVYVQLVVTDIAIRILNTTPKSLESGFKNRDENNFARRIIYGKGAKLPTPIVCRWSWSEVNSQPIEIPPGESCSPSRLDLALHLPNLTNQQLSEYIKVFDGNVEKIHLCETCSPDIVVRTENGELKTDIKSIWAAVIVNLASLSSESLNHYLEAARNTEKVSNLLGKRYLSIGGLSQAISMNSFQTQALIVLNLTSIVVIALWLALKAHRKVLDYFAKSGALLPMVAATGKRSFYFAIWILTLLRVAAFLVAALPLTLFSLSEMVSEKKIWNYLGNDAYSINIWSIALVSSLGLATLIASIAELKHRHNLLSFLYRYLPIFICAIGALIWLLTFLFEGTTVEKTRDLLAAIPIVGITPIIIAPILKPNTLILTIHAFLTILLGLALLRKNARWFAAHLEDL